MNDSKLTLLLIHNAIIKKPMWFIALKANNLLILIWYNPPIAPIIKDNIAINIKKLVIETELIGVIKCGYIDEELAHPVPTRKVGALKYLYHVNQLKSTIPGTVEPSPTKVLK
jgi:hypothetical protein